MNYITSSENKFFKEILKLKDRKYRKQKNCFLVEGVKFLEEAINNRCKIRYIAIDESKLDYIKSKVKIDELSFEIIVFSEKLFSKIKQTENSQGIIVCVEMKEVCRQFNFKEGIYFLIDKIQDPGNIGTIIRTAVAVDALGIIVVKGTVDLFNDKVLRASMGSIFKINIFYVEDYSFLDEFLRNDFKVIVTDSYSKNICYNEDLTGRVVLAVGNEGNGISDEVKNFPHVIDVCIPMSNELESLNVAQALSIVAFEYVRQSRFK